jgi:Zn-dependent M28 family amino/carboxypeptidase
MFDNYLKNIICLNNLNKEKRVDFITKKLIENSFTPQTQTFVSCFGEGKNVYARIGDISKQNTIVISAHYDGESFFDNTGGVIALLNLSIKFSSLDLPFPIIILFTDQEETYQQGAAYFLKLHSQVNISKHINIDGFGVGDRLYSVSKLIDNTKSCNDLFLSDSYVFLKHRIPSMSYFSAFSEDFLKAKKSNKIYYTFKKYESEAFFRAKYYENNKNNLIEKLCNLILIL